MGTSLLDQFIPSGGSHENLLVVFGGGGHGKSMIETIMAHNRYKIIGFVDEGMAPGSQVLGYTCLGGASILPELIIRGITLATNGVGGIGSVGTRVKVFDLLLSAGFSLPPIWHPSAVIEPSAILEDGVQIMPLSYIGGDAIIGFGSVINISACAPHDSKIGRVVNLSPHAVLAGNVTVGDHTQIGMSATVNLGITIGTRVRIGNSAVVKADVPDDTVIYAGTIWPTPKWQQQTG